MQPAELALTESASRKVRRAAGLLKDAVRDLAKVTDGPDVLGVHCAHDTGSIDAARELISMAVAQHGPVDVLVVARRRPNPTTTPNGVKEKIA